MASHLFRTMPVETAVFWDRRLSPVDKLLYMLLRELALLPEPRRLSLLEISELLNISESTARRARESLQENGLLVLVPSGPNTPPTYKLELPYAEEARPIELEEATARKTQATPLAWGRFPDYSHSGSTLSKQQGEAVPDTESTLSKPRDGNPISTCPSLEHPVHNVEHISAGVSRPEPESGPRVTSTPDGEPIAPGGTKTFLGKPAARVNAKDVGKYWQTKFGASRPFPYGSVLMKDLALLKKLLADYGPEDVLAMIDEFIDNGAPGFSGQPTIAALWGWRQSILAKVKGLSDVTPAVASRQYDKTKDWNPEEGF